METRGASLPGKSAHTLRLREGAGRRNLPGPRSALADSVGSHRAPGLTGAPGQSDQTAPKGET